MEREAGLEPESAKRLAQGSQSAQSEELLRVPPSEARMVLAWLDWESL